MNPTSIRLVPPLAAVFFLLAGCATDQATTIELLPFQSLKASSPVPPSAPTVAGVATGEFSEPIDDMKHLTRHPAPTFMPRPIFPSDMRQARMAGEAVIRIVIDTQGAVRIAEVVSASHPSFGKAGVAAALQWRFTPGVANGRNVVTQLHVPFDFPLD